MMVTEKEVLAFIGFSIANGNQPTASTYRLLEA